MLGGDFPGSKIASPTLVATGWASAPHPLRMSMAHLGLPIFPLPARQQVAVRKPAEQHRRSEGKDDHTDEHKDKFCPGSRCEESGCKLAEQIEHEGMDQIEAEGIAAEQGDPGI